VTYVDNFGTGRLLCVLLGGWRADAVASVLAWLQVADRSSWWICPSTTDPTTINTTLDYSTCSYIGRMATWGALSDSAASDTRVAGDDSYASSGNNHEVVATSCSWMGTWSLSPRRVIRLLRL